MPRDVLGLFWRVWGSEFDRVSGLLIGCLSKMFLG